MKNVDKYSIGYFMPPEPCFDWMKKDHIEKAPKWCSVDLRDGNQALIIPMSLEQKLEFFKYLVELGFKEIEVGFPAASDTEYQFLRAIIEQDLIPDDVTVQVLTQSREHIIKKTYEALKGAKNAVVHLYNSTSVAQREQVFRKSKEEIVEIAVSGAKLVKEFAEKTEGNFRFEYSPESFTGTEMEFALEICNKVLDIWQPTPDNKVIINLPATVQMSMPHVYASQVEYMSKNLKYRDAVEVSLHPHNDRGTGVADAEMGILAGADRVEGTLFGNGERTGNVDIVTVALNMFAQGVDPNLKFENMSDVVSHYELYTGMKVSDRHPYSGKLVFTAFSGSHQDAIAKGMKFREEKNKKQWDVPYLMIDPKDVGRDYDGDVIRINSQSGKGGIGYLMETKYGFDMPPKMRENFGYIVKGVSDVKHKEMMPDEVNELFYSTYVNKEEPIKLVEYHFINKGDTFKAYITVSKNGEEINLTADGNGRLDAVTNALRGKVGANFTDLTYKEHALSSGSRSQAAAYVGITRDDGKITWGVGIDKDIITASIKALIGAINN
ncbi:MAG: 2-isopropylmalate synthase [Clostridia bacterium]|jgi:2-isopropylmalate synthase|nr:2-isopropylmalate synthase [Clostridia bacterium]